MKAYWLLLAVLACWRITHLLNAEDGPREILVRFRRRAGDGFWGDLLDCFYCLSIWIAAPLAGMCGDTWRERLFLWPAISAGSILIERCTAREPAGSQSAPAVYFEELEENQHVLLRKEETSNGSTGPRR